jgi:hypothetical protein
MTLMDKLQLELNNLNLSNFFEDTRSDLKIYSVVVLDPHKKSNNSFISLVGIMGDNGIGERYNVDVIKEKAFIKMGTSEITIHHGRGLSMTFFVNPSALFSYVTYPVLKSTDISIADGEIRCELDEFLNLIHNVSIMRKDIDRNIRIQMKIYKKTYISKCNSMIKKSDEEIADSCQAKSFDKYDKYDAWRDSLKTLRDFMKKLD